MIMRETCWIVQNPEQPNVYRIFHPLDFLVAEVMLPNDGQYMLDSRLLSALVKAMNIRYRITSR